MRRQQKTKWVALVAAATLGISMAPIGSVSALETTWGPERETFTWESPSSYRTFNSITDNPSLGDERNFVRIREVGTESEYVDELNAEADKYYEVYVYFHNNAGANYNASGAGIANNVRLSMEIPENVNKGESATIKGTISSTNTEPEAVWDTAFLTANDYSIHLAYVENSAVIHSGGSIDGEVLDGVALLSDTGAKLGYWNDSWGIVPGCNEYAGYVTFELLVTTDEVPTTPEEPEEPEIPEELPNTGPLEVVLAIVIVAGIGGGGYYLYRTRRKLKMVEKSVAGKDVQGDEGNTASMNGTNAASMNDTNAADENSADAAPETNEKKSDEGSAK